jgi:SAM-dependent methyltransferase
MSSVAHRAIASQVALSGALGHLLPRSFRVDGSKDFKRRIVPNSLRPNLIVYDVGGGARPCIDLETKRRLNLTIVGVDVDDGEFVRAPLGVYDETIVCDIATCTLEGVADLVICKSTLEHVSNSEASLAAMGRILRPGGTLLVFVPSRNALYAKLNLLLPKNFKNRLLSTFFGQKADHLGFPAKYDRCTPRDFLGFLSPQNLELEQLNTYYISSYFSVVFPLYVIWRLWIVTYRALAKEQAAETFAIIARKR